MERLLSGEVTDRLSHLAVVEIDSSKNILGVGRGGEPFLGRNSFQYCTRTCTAGPRTMGCTIHCRPGG